jgi:hypothetical protein
MRSRQRIALVVEEEELPLLAVFGAASRMYRRELRVHAVHRQRYHHWRAFHAPQPEDYQVVEDARMLLRICRQLRSSGRAGGQVEHAQLRFAPRLQRRQHGARRPDGGGAGHLQGGAVELLQVQLRAAQIDSTYRA